MHFRDVVICDNPACGAILRITDQPGPISVRLRTGSFGTFVLCPRCGQITAIEAGELASSSPVLGQQHFSGSAE
jgi:hypothetical protein